MNKRSKILLLLLSCVLVFATALCTTLAFLTDKTDPLLNTFTVGNVAITMDEAKVNEYGQLLNEAGTVVENAEESARTTEGNTYRLIPGQSYVKDPTIKLLEGSEPCFYFAKITNPIGIVSFNMTDGWVKLDGITTEENTEVWYYSKKIEDTEANRVNGISIFSGFSVDKTLTGDDIAPYDDKTVSVVGYAIQAEGFTMADGSLMVNNAWSALSGSFTK